MATTAVLLLFSVFAFVGHGPSTYKFAPLFLCPIIWMVYSARKRIYLHPFHFVLLGLAFILHDMGTFGFYKRQFLDLQFDCYVHFYFGVAGGSILARALEWRFDLRGWRLAVGVILVILGIGAIHELIECASTIILGPGKGMLKLDDSNPFDTQKDLMNNGLGAILALVVYHFMRRSLNAAEESKFAPIKVNVSR